MASERTEELYRVLLSKGYPKELCAEIAYKNMNTDYTATRMLGYLYRYTNPKIEDLVDEMLAILSDEELGDKITMEQYYYNHMNKAQQAAYHSILSGVKNLADEFQIPALEGEELYNVFFQMRLDHPEIFWVSSYKYRYYKDSPNLIFIPEYLFDKKKICEHQKAMTARVEKLIRPAQKLSEWEKEKYVHDFICENIRYDKLKKSYSHEIIGPLGQGVGVCEGIAKAVKVLLDALGVWCVIAICGNNPEKGIKYRHTWNIVKIGGTYYHLDATFDNTLGKHSAAGQEIRYDYFNLDDSQIFRDHEPLIAPAPHCGDHEHFYYKEKKLSFTKKEDVYKRSLQAAKKGRVLIFHWRGGYLTKEVLKELLELIRKAGDEKDKTAMVSINWPQAVIRVQYTDMQVQESVTIEEANEEEQYDKAIILFEGLPRDYEDARNNFRE